MFARKGPIALIALTLVIGAAPGHGVAAPETVAVDGPLAPRAAVTSKVKTPKGVIDDVALARDPESGNVLAVYESDGRIFATLLKEKSGNKFKGRKAKQISSSSSIHHRPAATWDAGAGTWLVLWDTAPADLRAAAGSSSRARDDAYDIRGRRLKAGNGKPVGPEMVMDGGSHRLMTPQFVGEHSTTARRGSGRVHFSDVQLICGTDISDDLCQEVSDLFGGTVVPFPPVDPGPIDLPGQAPLNGLGVPKVANGELLLPLTGFESDGNRTARLARFDGSAITEISTTPANFSFVDTHSPAVICGPNGTDIFVWNEGPGCFFEFPDAPGSGVHRVPGAMHCEPLLDPAHIDGLRRRDETLPVLLALDGDASTGLLFALDAADALGTATTVFESKKGARAQAGAHDRGTGLVYVLWAETRNKKTSKLWLEVVDP